MAIIDNTLAAQVPTFDPATPLAQAAQLQKMQADAQAEKFKQNQVEMGSEMRGLQPFVNTPEFPAKWAESANRLLQRGVIDQQMHDQWANAPSPLLMKSIISKTEDPALSFRKEEAQREQKNTDRSFGLQKTNADRNYGLAARAADRADQTPLDKANERMQVLKANGVDPNSTEGKAYILSGEWTGPGTGGASLNPVYGTDAAGKPAIMQLTKSGQGIQTKTPDGFSIAKEPIKIDTGTAYQLYDPQTRQPVGAPIPKDLAGVEQQKTIGEETAKAQVALPQVIANSQQILKTIDDLQKHPGKEYSLGLYSKVPTIPGTPQADFRAAANQLKGQTFLQAYQTLRGGGAITDIEGAKGENALARLDQAQTTEAYDKALNDFKDVIKAGMLRAAAKARGAGGATAPAASGGKSQGAGADVMLQHARDAIAQGAPKAAVIERLKGAGIDPSGL